MNKKILRAAALAACFGILFLYVPGLATADTKAPSFDLKMLFKKNLARTIRSLGSYTGGIFSRISDTSSLMFSDIPSTENMI